jgi:hypothetical protein
MSDNITSFLFPFLLGFLICLLLKKKSVEYFSLPLATNDLESERNCDESFNFDASIDHAGRRETRLIPKIAPRVFDASNRTNRVSVFYDEFSGSEPHSFRSHDELVVPFAMQFNGPEMTSDGRSMGHVQQNILQVLDESYPINGNIAISELPKERQEVFYFPNMNSRLASRQDMYDPRQVGGYGDPMRRYLHSTVGNPQYFYDDLDSDASFFTRNNIESEWFGSSSRRLDPPNRTHRNLSEMSLDAFIERTNHHRADLQSSMMSKRNAELMQLRKFPIYRGDQIPRF